MSRRGAAGAGGSGGNGAGGDVGGVGRISGIGWVGSFGAGMDRRGVRRRGQQRRARPLAALQLQLRRDDGPELQPLGFQVRPHAAGQRTLVGNGQRRVAQVARTADQLLGVRGAGQEAEVAAAAEFGVGGKRGAAGASTPYSGNVDRGDVGGRSRRRGHDEDGARSRTRRGGCTGPGSG